MPVNYGTLGQTDDASVEQTLYTVAAGTNAKVKITVTNRAGATTFRVALAPAGVATANEHYVAYDKPLAANETTTSTTFTLNDNDVIRVESGTANVSFLAFGIERT